jgi:cytochrome c oxidase subunit 2
MAESRAGGGAAAAQKPGGLLGAAAAWLAGCAGPQSALDPAGRGAEHIAQLFWWMSAGALVVWIAVIALALWAVRVRPGPRDGRRAAWLIAGGGAVVPTVVLAILLVRGLASLPGLLARAPEGSLSIAVSGEQWWWRVRYQPAGGDSVVLANEIRLPLGEPVQFLLESADVIHSFWIPPLGGKVDMFPGRVTRLTLTATRTGVFRGACAEYCGTSHALMALDVVVEDRPAFERWLAHQRGAALPPRDRVTARGQNLFLAHGCAACHTIRGTPARGVVGPDLTHVGSRLSVGAGTLRSQPEAFERWIARTSHLKPEVLMPAFAMLPREDLKALAAYLDSLE